MFPDVTPLIRAMFILLCITVPLGLWKLIEIAAWITRHINISIQ